MLLAAVNITSLNAADLSGYKLICSELGFTEKTQLHGECVIKLLKRDKLNSQNASSGNTENNSSSNLESDLLNQQRIQLQTEQLQLQREMLAEAKRQRQLQALGMAKQGLDLAFPNTPPEKNTTSETPKNIWCGSYGVNTICNSN